MRVIISAGGTGGHIYPAIAIINKIKEEEPKSEILYIGTSDRMEKDLIPELGIKYKEINVSGLKRKLTLENFKVLYQFLKARSECKKIIKEFNPDVVIGAGGYVTGPVIWAAKKLGKKTFIHEQNSVVGLSNKYLTKYADKIGAKFVAVIGSNELASGVVRVKNMQEGTETDVAFDDLIEFVK
jgi:UDP-N-acetylglucosamine--N-acetylmuramyl-(pentapeptide) pyrophosphoryl-undecaprenol N-acetylglucosamine transferase